MKSELGRGLLALACVAVVALLARQLILQVTRMASAVPTRQESPATRVSPDANSLRSGGLASPASKASEPQVSESQVSSPSVPHPGSGDSASDPTAQVQVGLNGNVAPGVSAGDGFGVRPGPVAPTTSSVSVFFVDPPGYMRRQDPVIWDRQGNPRINTVLLAPDFPEAAGESDVRSGGHVGSSACAECHRDYYDGFVKTSHHLTSALATEASIGGSFEAGKNILMTSSPNIRFAMELVDNKPIQRMLIRSNGEEFAADFEFGLVTGSGKLGQTYLYWKGQHLYQMHASYLTSRDCWVNSPGFTDGTANFARPTLAPCLECHATYFESIGGTTNQFRKDNFILGVSCERCHGPGREHVEAHQKKPDLKAAAAIANPANMTVEQSIDMCQVCHGGMPQNMKKPAFSFHAGDKLDEFYTFLDSSDKQPGGVHSNAQLPRLKRSKCFQQSPQMTCVTCHDAHHYERNQLSLFSQRCQSCHQPEACGQFKSLGNKISENCIDCHMASVLVEDIRLETDQHTVNPTMRDHYIRIAE